MSAMQAGTQMVKLRGSSKGLVRFYFLDEHRSCIRWRPSRKNEKAKSEQAALGAGGAGGCLGGSGLPRGAELGAALGGSGRPRGSWGSLRGPPGLTQASGWPCSFEVISGRQAQRDQGL